jgi:dTDP-4-amino-4,6-dideoxygalactose transaminase
MPPLISMGDLRREHGRILPEIDEAIERVLWQGGFILGQEVEAFEAECAACCGVTYVVGVGNGTDAIHLDLWAAGIGHGGRCPGLCRRGPGVLHPRCGSPG